MQHAQVKPIFDATAFERNSNEIQSGHFKDADTPRIADGQPDSLQPGRRRYQRHQFRPGWHRLIDQQICPGCVAGTRRIRHQPRCNHAASRRRHLWRNQRRHVRHTGRWHVGHTGRHSGWNQRRLIGWLIRRFIRQLTDGRRLRGFVGRLLRRLLDGRQLRHVRRGHEWRRAGWQLRWQLRWQHWRQFRRHLGRQFAMSERACGRERAISQG